MVVNQNQGIKAVKFSSVGMGLRTEKGAGFLFS